MSLLNNLHNIFNKVISVLLSFVFRHSQVTWKGGNLVKSKWNLGPKWFRLRQVDRTVTTVSPISFHTKIKTRLKRISNRFENLDSQLPITGAWYCGVVLINSVEFYILLTKKLNLKLQIALIYLVGIIPQTKSLLICFLKMFPKVESGHSFMSWNIRKR